MQVLTNQQCEIVGGGRAISEVVASAAVGASKTAASTFVALSAFEYTSFAKQVWTMPFYTYYTPEQIVQSSLIAGGVYFAGYIGASIYCALQPSQ